MSYEIRYSLGADYAQRTTSKAEVIFLKIAKILKSVRRKSSHFAPLVLRLENMTLVEF